MRSDISRQNQTQSIAESAGAPCASAATPLSAALTKYSYLQCYKCSANSNLTSVALFVCASRAARSLEDHKTSTAAANSSYLHRVSLAKQARTTTTRLLDVGRPAAVRAGRELATASNR